MLKIDHQNHVIPDGSEPVYQRRLVSAKLTPSENQLKQALIADSYRPQRARRTALKLFEASALTTD